MQRSRGWYTSCLIWGQSQQKRHGLRYLQQWLQFVQTIRFAWTEISTLVRAISVLRGDMYKMLHNNLSVIITSLIWAKTQSGSIGSCSCGGGHVATAHCRVQRGSRSKQLNAGLDKLPTHTQRNTLSTNGVHGCQKRQWCLPVKALKCTHRRLAANL